MGVPALFRWLSERYPKIVSKAAEEQAQVINGVTIPVDVTQPNPNGVEYDNLYLDLNGIVHPCCHPEDSEPPPSEEHMMLEIFKYLDRIMGIIRPRKLLYIAIDGVAPRAKMNQQRSRRFGAGLEAREALKEKEKQIEKLRNDGIEPNLSRETFDSNCITPGTPFMDKLSASLKYYIADRLNTDTAWRNVNVIFSDSSYPGEGEHKIMDYIRRTRNSPGHDPNTRHVIYGLDADLIMLSLATHEPYFTVLREDVSFKKKTVKKCRNCGEAGHWASSCLRPDNPKLLAENSSKAPKNPPPFVLLHINVLREYLQLELKVNNLNFEYDFENAIDDWIFLIFFVGNDFLPHLPTLNIREGAVDKLIRMWKNSLNQMGGYMTKAGDVKLERVQVILEQLASLEDGILSKRLQQDQIKKDKAARICANQERSKAWNQDLQNQNAASELKASLSNHHQDGKRARENDSTEANGAPNKVAKAEPEGESPYFNEDISLGTPGYKSRYYLSKFGVPETDTEFPATVAKAYMEGLCWVLKYYYQGCRSWKWYYPYHYAPFASDFTDMDKYDFDFKLGQPSRPYEQLMSVLPSDSKQHLPKPLHFLMEDPESPVLDFYPRTFKLDMNGAHATWLAIALLPFIDEQRLQNAINEVYPQLTPDEHRRNKKGHEILFVSQHNPLYPELLQLHDKESEQIDLDPNLSSGIPGSASKDPNCKPNEVYSSPLSQVGCPDLPNDTSISVHYHVPEFPEDHVHPTNLKPGLTQPPKVLNKGDIDTVLNGGTRNFGRHDYARHEYYKGRENYERQTHHDLIQDGFINDGNAPEGYNRFFPSSHNQPRPRHNDHFQNFNGGRPQRGGYNGGHQNYGYNFAPHGQSHNNFSHQNQGRPRPQYSNRSAPQGPPQVMQHSFMNSQGYNQNYNPRGHPPPRGRGNPRGRGGYY